MSCVLPMTAPPTVGRPRVFKCLVELPISLAFGNIEEAWADCIAAGEQVTHDLYCAMLSSRANAKQPLWPLVDGQHMPRSRPAVLEMMVDMLTSKGWTIRSEALRPPGQEPSWGVRLEHDDPRYDPIEAGGFDEVTAMGIAWHLANASSLIVLPK